MLVNPIKVNSLAYLFNTGWERTGHMLCIVDTSLSVLVTWRMCSRDMCCFLLFGFKPLGKGVLLIYVFIMAIFGDG